MNLNRFSVNDAEEVIEILTVPITGVVASAGGPSVINLSWNAAADAQSYSVSRSLTPNGSFTVIASGMASTSLTDTGRTPFTTYYYSVNGTFDGVDGPSSSVASARTDAEPITAENTDVSYFGFGLDSNNNPQISFSVEQTGLGQLYQIYKSETMLDDWEAMGEPWPGTGGSLDMNVLFDFTDPNAPSEFFRIGVSLDD